MQSAESATFRTLPGYHGRYLRIDLANRTSSSIPIPNQAFMDFIGGVGLGTWLLLRETHGRPDPLAPEAPLAFVFSPLVSSPLTTSAKFAVVAKSPLTLRLNDALSSSHFAIAGKKTGYDAIVVIGRADEPLILVVETDRVRFEGARDIQGQSSALAQQQVVRMLGSDFRVASIGPAGENLVRFATISHDGRHAGRGGLGAVMGSKNLKALAVRGDRQVAFARPDELVRYSRELSRKSFGPATEKYRELGTVSNLLTFNRLGTLPTRNFQQASFEGAQRLAPETVATTHERTRASCAACTIGCEHLFHRDHDDPGVRLEYENLFALGPLCGVADPDVVLAASRACDELGMDTISAGATIAFAMECAERGLLDAPGLRFGSGTALLDTLRAIGSVTGVGALLSRGTRAAAQSIGQGSDEFAPHVKGLEIPGYEPRAMQTMALGFAVGTRGADHNRSGAYQVDFAEGVDRLNIDSSVVARAIDTENEAAIMDSLILCKFLRGVFEDRMASMGEMLNLVTGRDVSAADLAATARRIVSAKKWFNITQGWTPAEDTLPGRFLSSPLTDGPGHGTMLTAERLQELIHQYNRQRGWTEDGWLSETDRQIVSRYMPVES